MDESKNNRISALMLVGYCNIEFDYQGGEKVSNRSGWVEKNLLIFNWAGYFPNVVKYTTMTKLYLDNFGFAHSIFFFNFPTNMTNLQITKANLLFWLALWQMFPDDLQFSIITNHNQNSTYFRKYNWIRTMKR